MQKRAALLARGHVSTGRVPSVEEANTAENILMPPSACQPRVAFGCSLDELLLPAGDGSSVNGSSGGSSGSLDAGAAQERRRRLEQLVQLYKGEQYLLTWQGGTAWVALLEGAGRADMLRAMWQAAWLDHHQGNHAGSGTAAPPGSSSNSSGRQGGCDGEALLAASLAAMRRAWPDFEEQAAAQGWQLDRAVLPQGTARLRLE